MDVFLTTERLTLRRLTADDEDNLVELDSDPDVMHYLNGGRPTPRATIRENILPRLLGYYERPPCLGFWAAMASGEFVGWFCLRPSADSPSEVELGYRLCKSAWGLGYATEGSLALIDKGFAEFGITRVYARTMVVNKGSRRVMEKSGLVLVRTFHQDWPDHIEGAEHGDVEYELTKEQWLTSDHS
jgi:RimJ/RimL family protein N-acetyltransferase